MTTPVLNTGRLAWSGEHWINAIRTAGSSEPSAWFSLYHTRYCEAGEGNVLQLVIPGANISCMLTDNRTVGDWVMQCFFNKSSVRTRNARIMEAAFRREGESQRNPAWVVEFDCHQVVARWHVSEAPVIAYGPFQEDAEFFTLLFFTDDSTVELDGKMIEGEPYPRDIWKASIGGERSSSVFALAETLIES